MFQKILAVCVGNVCRSPMVEYLMRNDPLVLRSGTAVSSAGLAALVDRRVDATVLELMLDRGIDLSAHRARQLTPSLLFDADLVLVMELWQQREIERLYPASRGRVQTLGRWRDLEIPDPYGKARLDYENALALIEDSLAEWRLRLW